MKRTNRYPNGRFTGLKPPGLRLSHPRTCSVGKHDHVDTTQSKDRGYRSGEHVLCCRACGHKAVIDTSD